MLAAFLGDFPGEVGVKRLEEDGVSYLRFYALPDSGGPRAVQVWERLRKDYGSQISPETLTTVEWSLVHLISSGEGIDKAAIENLKSLRVSSLPRPVAVLVGNLLVKVGLGPTVLTLLALLTPILMLVLAIIFPDLGIRAARVIRGMVTDSPQAALVGEVSRSPLVVLGGKDTIRRLLDPPGSVDYVHPSSTTKSHEFEPAGDAGPAAGEEAESGTDGARECSRVDGDRAPSPDQPDTASTPTPADTAALPGRASGGTSEDR